MEECLGPLFSAPHIIKLGLELTGDLRKLTNSYPHVAAFKTASSALDLKSVWNLYQGPKGKKYSSTQRRTSSTQVGLSLLARELLGKPLDKTMQVCVLVLLFSKLYKAFVWILRFRCFL